VSRSDPVHRCEGCDDDGRENLMKTRGHLAARGVAVLLVLLASACSGSGSGSDEPSARASGPTVTLKHLQFQPAARTVKPGTTETWVDDEPITHTVTSGAVTGIDPTSGLRSGQTPDGRFDHRLESKGATASYRFTEPGTYSYFCSIHQGMNASVVVTA
jgi:plastocyanin